MVATPHLQRTIPTPMIAIKNIGSMFSDPDFSTQPGKSRFLYKISQFSNVGLSFYKKHHMGHQQNISACRRPTCRDLCLLSMLARCWQFSVNAMFFHLCDFSRPDPYDVLVGQVVLMLCTYQVCDFGPDDGTR